MFGWPALFYLRGCALKKASPARTDRCVCYLYLYLFLPLFIHAAGHRLGDARYCARLARGGLAARVRRVVVSVK